MRTTMSKRSRTKRTSSPPATLQTAVPTEHRRQIGLGLPLSSNGTRGLRNSTSPRSQRLPTAPMVATWLRVGTGEAERSPSAGIRVGGVEPRAAAAAPSPVPLRREVSPSARGLSAGRLGGARHQQPPRRAAPGASPPRARRSPGAGEVGAVSPPCLIDIFTAALWRGVFGGSASHALSPFLSILGRRDIV